MKLFKLFALSLVTMPSVALGMGFFSSLYNFQNTRRAIFGDKIYNLSQVKDEVLRQEIKSCVENGEWTKAYCDHVLDPQRIASITQIVARRPDTILAKELAPRNSVGGFRHVYCGDKEFRVCDYPDNQFDNIFEEDGIAQGKLLWYRSSSVICSGAVALTLGYYCRNALWAGIKSLFSR